MDQSNDTVIERVRVREVAGIFRSRDALDATVDALLESGFDRADIAVSSRYAAREKLGIDIPAEVIFQRSSLFRGGRFSARRMWRWSPGWKSGS
jgi:hypothetical protein